MEFPNNAADLGSAEWFHILTTGAPDLLNVDYMQIQNVKIIHTCS